MDITKTVELYFTSTYQGDATMVKARVVVGPHLHRLYQPPQNRRPMGYQA